MSIANLFEINLDSVYANTVTSFGSVRTNRLDTTDPQPLYIADQVATDLYLGNSLNPIDVFINGTLYTGGSKGDKGDKGDTGSGVTGLAAIGATPNANGATVSGLTLNLEPASNTFGGVLTTGAQSIAGQKTFINTLNTTDRINIIGSDLTVDGDIRAHWGSIQFNSTGDLYFSANSSTPVADFDCGITGHTNLSLMNDTSEIIINGERALHTYGPDNVFVGNSGNQTLIGNANTLMGNLCGNNCDSAASNTFMGYTSANSLTSGSFNVGVGRSASFSITDGWNNTAIGSSAMYSNTLGNGNVAVGSSALSSSSPSGTVAIGFGSLQSQTIGDADYAVAVGYESAKNAPSFQRGVAIGWRAGSDASHTNDNIIIGFNAGNAGGGGSNNIILGSDGALGDNQIMIGRNTHTSCNIQGINGYGTSNADLLMTITSGGNIGTESQYSSPSALMTSNVGSITASTIRGGVVVAGTMVDVRFSRFGRMCTCVVPAFTVTTSVANGKIFVMSAGDIPAAFRPAYPIECSAPLYTGATTFAGTALFHVGTDGSLSYNMTANQTTMYGPAGGDASFTYFLN